MSTSLTTVSVEMWDEQQAEIERLRAENNRLRASCAKLRAALEWYVKGRDSYVARAALNEDEETK